MNLNNIISIFKLNSYKLTEQRLALLTVLVENNDKVLSVEQLYDKAKIISTNTNMSTIYRNLEILENLDLIYKFVTEQGVAYYKLVCNDTHHHHLICKNCGKTFILDYCIVDELKPILNKHNFTLTDHKIELYGFCSSCKDKQKELY